MKYSKQEIEVAIRDSGLSPCHQKSLHELLGHRGNPLVLGYIVYAIGFAFLALFVYLFYLAHVHDIGVNTLGLDRVIGATFILSLFLASGAQTYMNRIRASRAVAELLLKGKASEPAGSGYRAPRSA